MENLLDTTNFVPDWIVKEGSKETLGAVGPIGTGKHVVLVAHDNKKADLLEWAAHNREVLTTHHIYATGSTGRLIRDKLQIPVKRFLSGPLGGDQQIGAFIAQGAIDLLVFSGIPWNSNHMIQT